MSKERATEKAQILRKVSAHQEKQGKSKTYWVREARIYKSEQTRCPTVEDRRQSINNRSKRTLNKAQRQNRTRIKRKPKT